MSEVKAFMMMLAIGNICYAILMMGYYRTGAPDLPLKVWTWAKAIEGCAFFAFWLRAGLPTTANAFTSNGLLILAAIAQASAYCLFLGHQWYRRLCIAALFSEGLLAAGVFAHASLTQLAILVSIIISVIAAACAIVLIMTKPRFAVLRCIIGIPNLLVSLAFLWRAYVGLTGGTLTVFTPGWAQTTIYLSAYFLLIVNGFGFLLLCKQKDENKLLQLATIDSLTGVFNRYAFLREAERVQSLSQRISQQAVLLMMDIDHFKPLNDQYGHALGDHALHTFAQIAQATLRKSDIFGRLGGEEFAAVLPMTDVRTALHVAKRLRDAIGDCRLGTEEKPISMTVSIGVAELSHSEDVGMALMRADQALYVAKRNGRNRVEVAHVSNATPAHFQSDA